MKLNGKRTIAQIALAVSFMTGALASNAAEAQSYSVLDLGLVSARALNDSGQVAGLVQDNGSTYAFLTAPNSNGLTLLQMPSGGVDGAGLGLNNLGQVVGSYTNSEGVTHGFVTGANGIGLTDLISPDGQFAVAESINASGQIAGTGPNEAFLSTQGQWQSLGTLGGGYSIGHAVNASGQVVGYSTTSTDNMHAFVTGTNGQGMLDLGTLANTYSEARAINAYGVVVGSSSTDGYVHAFVADTVHGGMFDLTPGLASSEAYGINDQGNVVGYFVNDPYDSFHAFIANSDGSSFIDLTNLVSLGNGETLSTAVAINNANQILVEATNGHSYLLTPTAVPEPGSAWTMLLGLAGLGWLRRKR